MKIAIAADLHLNNQSPERLETFENLLSELPVRGIENLIIAGDLFDAHQSNYSNFEEICRNHPAIRFLVIPGNHDPEISSRMIAADNLRIFTQPELLQLDETDLYFLFLPYQVNKSMGEAIAGLYTDLQGKDWVLVGHGDYTGSLQYSNPYEDGTYMPLTKKDIQRFSPRRVFLGHIHIPHEKDGVHTCGSPCGLNITETGRRRFLVFDTANLEVVPVPINSPRIYFDEKITVLPMEDEQAYILKKAAQIIQNWNIAGEEKNKIIVRIRFKGYTSNKTQLAEIANQVFKDYQLYEEPDIRDVSGSTDLERTAIAQNVLKRVSELPSPDDPDEPSSEEIFEQALRLIFGS